MSNVNLVALIAAFDVLAFVVFNVYKIKILQTKMCGSIKVFIPTSIFYQKYQVPQYLYGHIKPASELNPTTYYVLDNRSISSVKAEHFSKILPIGQISIEAPIQNVDTPLQKQFIRFKANKLYPNILLDNVECTFEHCHHAIETAQRLTQIHVRLVLFDLSSFRKLMICQDVDTSENYQMDDIEYLQYLLRDTNVGSDFVVQTSNGIVKAFGSNRIVKCIRCGLANVLALKFVKETAVARHFQRWHRTFIMEPLTMSKICAIISDVIVGIVIMISLLYFERSHTFMIHSTELIVENLRYLLDALKGFPVGLKLNVELNNFFLNIFTYHIDLWATFLVTISPIIKYLCIPLAVLGCFGLSFQLALFCDLLVLVTLHGHCFYVYVAVLYRIEIVGIRSLWNVLLGRNKNPLKHRIESYEYTNSQLYLATIFFSAMLFLFPTIVINYMVFASLRFGVYCITYVLICLQYKILNFPIFNLYCWIYGCYITANSAEISFARLQQVQTKRCECVVSALQVDMKASAWDEVAPTTKFYETMPTVGQFFVGLVKGEMMGFIQPLTTCIS